MRSASDDDRETRQQYHGGPHVSYPNIQSEVEPAAKANTALMDDGERLDVALARDREMRLREVKRRRLAARLSACGLFLLWLLTCAAVATLIAPEYARIAWVKHLLTAAGQLSFTLAL